ncbi:MAG TPA: SAM-dependent methyltransferase [Aquabacterium sp.]|nr:SAM-dependent methyltransferase [Aquabacterium sp.]
MTPPATRRGTLVLMPNTLDLGTGHEVALAQVLPQAAIERATGLRHWVAENAKSTRAFLKRVHACRPLALPLQEIDIRELPRPRKGGGTAGPAANGDLESLLAPALAGEDVGLLSEAGLPAIADPGAGLVAAAHAIGVPVDPLPGPSSLLLALAASGLNGQSFAFTGYLPIDAAARAARIRELDALSRRLQQTQIAIETPYRNAALLGALAEHLNPATRLAIACGLTLPGGWCRTLPAARWRETPATLPDTMPAVFCWLG